VGQTFDSGRKVAAEEWPMTTIGRFPPFGKRFFRRIRKAMGPGHFGHFWRLAMSIASMPGRRSIARMRTLNRNYRTRQAIAHFLNLADWDAPELLRQKAMDTLAQLGFRPGDSLYFILDDTQQRKYGRLMQAVSKMFLHAEKYYANGHTILVGCLLYRGVLIPYAVRLWASEKACAESQKQRREQDRIDFVKLTELAAEMIREAKLPERCRVISLFDSYYLCTAVVKACQDRNWDYISVAKKNRNFYPGGNSKDQRKVADYGKKVLAKDGKWLKVKGKRQNVAFRHGRLSKGGWVKLVFSQRPGQKGFVALASNRRDWEMATILGHYFQRWPVELLFKMSKQELGLGDYQVLRYRGVVRYLHLVMIAYLLLTHLALDAPDAQAAIKERRELRLPSVPQLQQHLRQLLWNDTVASLAGTARSQRFADKLKDIFMF
jgi:SRSO17 transposase